MSDQDPFDGENFSFDPAQMFSMLGDISKLFGGKSEPSGAGGWDMARQLAGQVARGTESEDNVDPAERMAWEQLTRVAELHVQQTTGLALTDAGPITVRPATRHEWATNTVEAYRPLLEVLGGQLAEAVSMDTDDLPAEIEDPQVAMLGGLMKMIGPMMLSMTAGSMAGHLSHRSLGGYDLPIPRDDATELLVVHSNIASFAEEWSVEIDDVRLWVCVHEMAHHAVLRIPHVRDRLFTLLRDYSRGFRPDERAIRDRFGAFDISDPSSMESITEAMNDPEAIIGVMQSDDQRELVPFIGALVTVIKGYVDWVMDEVGSNLIGSYPMISEALRRRRVTANPSDHFVGRMLGIELDRETFERGQKFVEGVVERAGAERLARLWETDAFLPTPNEIEAPGLWIARTDLQLN